MPIVTANEQEPDEHDGKSTNRDEKGAKEEGVLAGKRRVGVFLETPSGTITGKQAPVSFECPQASWERLCDWLGCQRFFPAAPADLLQASGYARVKQPEKREQACTM